MMTTVLCMLHRLIARAQHRGARAPGAPILAASLALLLVGASGVVSGLRPTAAAAMAPKAYIGLYGDNAVGVLDTGTGRVLRTIPIPAGPEGVLISPDQRRVYVTSEDATALSVIDTATDTVVRTLDLGKSPQGLALTRDGRTLLATVFDTGQVEMIDTATYQVVARFPVAKPHGVALSPDGRTAYVGSQDAPDHNALVILDLQGQRVAARVPLDKTPRGLTVSPDGAALYFTLAASDAVQVLDTASNRIVAQIPVGPVPHQIAFTPNRRYALVVVQGSNQLAFVDPVTRRLVTSVAVGKFPHWVGLASDGSAAYVTNEGANSVSVVDVGRQQVVATLSVGKAPRKIAVQRGAGARGGDLPSAATPAAAPLTAQVPARAQAVGATAEIHIKDFAFGPATVTVASGQEVTWVNDDSVPHTSTSEDKQWDSGNILPGGRFAFTFSKPGTYVYNCTVHPFMQAKIVVGQ